ncbi:MAG TPA: hypothetical protein VEZ42_10990 [Pseudonocardia sp.]|nr:hypothetical protein [Pseudonocardia sp.]
MTVRIADAVLVVADQDVMIRFFVDLTRHRPARPRGAVGRPR